MRSITAAMADIHNHGNLVSFQQQVPLYVGPRKFIVDEGVQVPTLLLFGVGGNPRSRTARISE